jgi:hypothetical protein
MTFEEESAGAPAIFEFEIVREMSEADYLEWHTVPVKLLGWGFVLRCLVTVLAILCFLDRRTAPLGILFGIAIIAVWAEPLWSRSVNRIGYRFSEYLHGPLTYGVSSRGMWFRGGALRAESTWVGLGAWGEHDAEFWLAPRGMPQLRFPIAALREAGIYKPLRELATGHSLEYFSAAARAGRARRRAPAS